MKLNFNSCRSNREGMFVLQGLLFVVRVYKQYKTTHISIWIIVEVIMKGEIISKEFKRMVWVSDKDGAQYACYADNQHNIKRKEDLTDEDQKLCMNLNVVLGDSW